MRWNKTVTFLKDAATLNHLILAGGTLKPALASFGRSFMNSRLRSTDISIFMYLGPVTSPAEATVKAIGSLLGDIDSRHWLPMLGVEGWAPERLATCAHAMLLFAGGLFLRCISQFSEWPWCVGKL
eukprot:4343067-Pyramimonas_sp.AAC.1